MTVVRRVGGTKTPRRLDERQRGAYAVTACRCPLRGYLLQHADRCAVVVERRAVLRLFARISQAPQKDFNPKRRAVRAWKRRAGKQAVA